MRGKIEITGKIEVVTGMHIGGSDQFAAIGAIDSPVIKDITSGLPMIPGSSLKGKMRTLLAKVCNDLNNNPENDIKKDCEEIKRLFGYSDKKEAKCSRLIFTDAVLENAEELKQYGIDYPTEVKFENTINRLSGIANPRQIERVVRGSLFPLQIIYNIEKEEDVAEDMAYLKKALELLKYDYLGGHGSRGYGRIEIKELEVSACTDDVEENLVQACNEILRKA